MNNRPVAIFGDFDSLCYPAGGRPSIQEMQYYINGKIKSIYDAVAQARPGRQILPIQGFVEATHNKSNYRKYVSAVLGVKYKGSRTSPKPPLLNEAKDYLRAQYNVQFVSDRESEDVVSFLAYEYGLDDCVIAAIDKDLLQIPATFYNYQKDILITVSEGEALLNFHAQVLSGDSNDSITGLAGIGKAKALQCLKGCTTEAAMVEVVGREYYTRGYTLEYLRATALLIRLQRTRSEVYQYPVTEDMWKSFEEENTNDKSN